MNIVKEGYNKIAEKYDSQRDQFANKFYLIKFHKLLKKSSKILDLGCGSGVPIDLFLAKQGHQVIGIDISEKQIELAKRNVPKGIFYVKDMSRLKYKEYSVDAVVSFYAIFHTRREKHRSIFSKIHSFLRQNGLILVTMGASDWEGTEDFHGVKMRWSHYDAKKNRQLIESAGFKILIDEIDSSGSEKHQVILARKQ